MLSGCSASTSEGVIPSPSTSKEAGIFSKDVQVCFTNTSGSDVTVSWDTVSTSSEEGTLTQGTQFCGEGTEPIAKLTFGDGTSFFVQGINPAIGAPEIAFNSTTQTYKSCDESGGACIEIPRRYTYESFSEGESKTVTVRSHIYSIKRTANNAWVNFEIEIRG